MSDIEEIRKEIKRLESIVKERENSTIRAIKTFIEDYSKYQSGKTQEFPLPAFFGLVFSYIRPRMVLILGSFFAAMFTFLQVVILVQQNNLIKNQNQLLAEQTEATNLQAVSFITSRFDPNDPSRNELAIVELSESGDTGFSVLRRLASREGQYSNVAIASLVENSDKYDLSQRIEILESILKYVGRLISRSLQGEEINSEVPIAVGYVHKLSSEILDSNSLSQDSASNDKLTDVLSHFFSHDFKQLQTGNSVSLDNLRLRVDIILGYLCGQTSRGGLLTTSYSYDQSFSGCDFTKTSLASIPFSAGFSPDDAMIFPLEDFGLASYLSRNLPQGKKQRVDQIKREVINSIDDIERDLNCNNQCKTCRNKVVIEFQTCTDSIDEIDSKLFVCENKFRRDYNNC